jgi:hypothetical protein
MIQPEGLARRGCKREITWKFITKKANRGGRCRRGKNGPIFITSTKGPASRECQSVPLTLQTAAKTRLRRPKKHRVRFAAGVGNDIRPRRRFAALRALPGKMEENRWS